MDEKKNKRGEAALWRIKEHQKEWPRKIREKVAGKCKSQAKKE